MNCSFNRDQLTFKFSVDKENYDQDLLMGIRLQRLVESEEWKILAAEWMKADTLYREAIMKVGMTDEKDKRTAKKAAAYNGFNEAVNFVDKIIKACNSFRKSEIKRMETVIEESSKEDLGVPNYD